MRPLKPIFALDYIEETQIAYMLARNSKKHSEPELLWANAVLIKYYQTVKLKSNVLLSQLSKEFDEFNKETLPENKNLIPYKNSQLSKVELTYQQLEQFIRARRSTRWFTKKNVCHDKIKQAITVASQAPSACNRQPYEFFVVDQQPLLLKISKLAIGAGGFAENIPCIVVVVGDYSYYENMRDRHIIHIDSSLAAMQFMLALPTLGLSSCPLNWPELSVVDRQIEKLLKLPKYKKTIMLIAVGEADENGGIPFSQKKTAEELTNFMK